MTVEILPAAREDLAAGFTFYEEQEAGLGSYFLHSLIADIDSLRLYAGAHRKVFGFHRLLSTRFPFAVYYSQEPESFVVRAVLDCRQDPQWTERRLTR